MAQKQKEIALELLQHTKNIYLNDFILRYIHKVQTLKPPLDKSDEDNLQLLKFHRCIERIEYEMFNFSDWHLHEIPIDGLFCFVKMENDSYLAFDLVYDNKTDKVNYVNFLGEEAPFPCGAFLIPILLKYPVYYFFALREKDKILSKKYNFYIHSSKIKLDSEELKNRKAPRTLLR